MSEEFINVVSHVNDFLRSERVPHIVYMFLDTHHVNIWQDLVQTLVLATHWFWFGPGIYSEVSNEFPNSSTCF